MKRLIIDVKPARYRTVKPAGPDADGYHVFPEPDDNQIVWLCEWRGFGRRPWSLLKADAIEEAVHEARKHAALGGRAQLVIHKADGSIQSERTYPRSSDPKRRRG